MNKKLFSFNNVRLSVPESWDLDKYGGDCRNGDLVMDNGKRQVLDAQWASIGNAGIDTVEKKCVLNLKGVEVRSRIELEENMILFLADHMEAGRIAYLIVLQKEIDRYVVFRFFSPKGDIKYFAKSIVKPMSEVAKIPLQEWLFFSTRFLLPQGFLLTDSSINVGSVNMVFEREARRLTLWDISLLNYIEKSGSVVDYALNLVAVKYKKKYKFLNDSLEMAGENDFFIKGKKRKRWMLSLGSLLVDNRRVWLQGISNRNRNRFSVVFFEYSQPEDLEWLDGLAESLRADYGVLAVEN